MREKEFLPLIKEKLDIEVLNPMQQKMLRSFSEARDIILLSPTGSGKTLAFILPVLKLLKPSTGRVQAVVIAPSRELVIQITKIMNSIAAGFKVTPLYGGHKVEDEVNSLAAGTDIVVAT
ncbi:MAG: DEAD/DEAH box helicase, partial [Muribaculaceae bacterium]|nr:DEAD/DEAH box helicase [Muribaculaceae bacterium]